MTNNKSYPERLGILKRLIKTIYESERQMTDEEKIYDLIVQAGEMQQYATDLHTRATAAINGLEKAAKDLKELTEAIRGGFDFFLHLVALAIICGSCLFLFYILRK
jgi:hypothetical protein